MAKGSANSFEKLRRTGCYEIGQQELATPERTASAGPNNPPDYAPPKTPPWGRERFSSSVDIRGREGSFVTQLPQIRHGSAIQGNYQGRRYIRAAL